MQQNFEVYCPSCDRIIPTADINIDQLVARCLECDTMFTVLPPTRSGSGSRNVMTDSPSRPSGVVVERGGGATTIRLSWFQPSLFFLLFFCIAWDSFLVFWYSIAIFGAGGNMQWLAILFPVCHVAVGIWLTYFVICGFVNRTQVKVDKYQLEVSHGPLPWFGNRRINCDQILELEILPANQQNAENSLQKCLAVHQSDGTQVILLSSIDHSVARYVAWHLGQGCKVPVKLR